MRIQLTDEHILEYDGMGYILYVKMKTPRIKNGKLKEWDTEGYYGTIEQVSVGMYRHKVHASGVTTVKELVELQNEFRKAITTYLHHAVARQTDFDDENE